MRYFNNNGNVTCLTKVSLQQKLSKIETVKLSAIYSHCNWHEISIRRYINLFLEFLPFSSLFVSFSSIIFSVSSAHSYNPLVLCFTLVSPYCQFLLLCLLLDCRCVRCRLALQFECNLYVCSRRCSHHSALCRNLHFILVVASVERPLK